MARLKRYQGGTLNPLVRSQDVSALAQADRALVLYALQLAGCPGRERHWRVRVRVAAHRAPASIARGIALDTGAHDCRNGAGTGGSIAA